jgi:hypothetical protein
VLERSENYTPVVNIESLRLVLAEAVSRGWYIHTLDIKNAYLNSDLKSKFRDNGQIKRLLGMEFKYLMDKGELYISTTDKIRELIELVGESNLPNSTKVPINFNELFHRPSPSYSNITKYQSLIGKLNFIIYRSRSDCLTYFTKLARNMKNPTVGLLLFSSFKISSLFKTND